MAATPHIHVRLCLSLQFVDQVGIQIRLLFLLPASLATLWAYCCVASQHSHHTRLVSPADSVRIMSASNVQCWFWINDKVLWNCSERNFTPRGGFHALLEFYFPCPNSIIFPYFFNCRKSIRHHIVNVPFPQTNSCKKLHTIRVTLMERACLRFAWW